MTRVTCGRIAISPGKRCHAATYASGRRQAEVPPDEYRAVLVGAGLPAPFAEVLVDADVQAAKGDLDDASGELRRLIGRPTTSLAAAVRTASSVVSSAA
jgi:hypothetical protein